jgi:hypothetical protein
MYYEQMLNRLFFHLSDYNVHDFSQQGDVAAHIANNSLAAFCNIFVYGIISRPLCPARSSNLTPCDYYLLGSFVNNPHTHTEDKLKEIIRRAVSLFSRQFVIIVCHQLSEFEAISSTTFNRRLAVQYSF